MHRPSGSAVTERPGALVACRSCCSCGGWATTVLAGLLSAATSGMLLRLAGGREQHRPSFPRPAIHNHNFNPPRRPTVLLDMLAACKTPPLVPPLPPGACPDLSSGLPSQGCIDKILSSGSRRPPKVQFSPHPFKASAPPPNSCVRFLNSSNVSFFCFNYSEC